MINVGYVSMVIPQVERYDDDEATNHRQSTLATTDDARQKKTRGAEISLTDVGPLADARARGRARHVTRPLRTHRLTYHYTCVFFHRAVVSSVCVPALGARQVHGALAITVLG